MAFEDYELILKVGADLGKALQGLATLSKAVGKAGDTAAKTGEAAAGLDQLSFGEGQIAKASQSLSRYRANLEAAKAAGDDMGKVGLSDTTLYRANQALSSYRNNLATARAAASALSAEEAQTTERIAAMVQASLAQQAAQRDTVAEMRSASSAAGAVSKNTDDYTEALRRQNAQMRQSSTAVADDVAAERELTAATKQRSAAQKEAARLPRELAKRPPALPGSAGVSQGQSANALRQLPAQITDITTGLATGQSPLTVLLQQGGQIKDSFGGIRPAITAVTAALSPMVVGLAATAAGFAAVAVAVGQEVSQQQAFNRAVAQSGNYAGVTYGQVQQLASGMGNLNQSSSEVRAGLIQLVASGKVSGAALQAVGQATLDMATLDGKSVEDTAAKAQQSFDGTAAGAAKLNEQYHFLTEAQYEQIKALELQGQQQQALALEAEAFHASVQPRVAELTGEVYGLAKAWDQVKQASSSWYEDFKQGVSLIVGAASDQQRIYALLAKKQDAQQGSGNAAGRLVDSVINPAYLGLLPGGLNLLQSTRASFSDSDQSELDALQKKVSTASTLAEQTAQTSRVNADAIAATQEIDTLAGSIDKATGKQQALEKLRVSFERLWAAAGPENKQLTGVQRIVGTDGAASFAGGLYDKLVADINDKYKPTKTKDTSDQLASSQKALQEQLLSLSSSLNGPVTQAWDNYSKTMLQAATAGGQAIKAGSDPTQVQATIKQIQAKAAQVRDDAVAQQERQLQISYLQSTGQTAQAAGLQLQQQYSKTLSDMQAAGDQAGVKLVQSLINVGQAQAQLQQLQSQVDQVLSSMSQQEQTIQAEQNAGLITEVDARKQILDLHTQIAAKVQELLPQMQALAEATGNPETIARVQALQGQIDRLKLSTNDLQVALNNGIQSGLGSLVNNLISQTGTLRDSITGLMQDIANQVVAIPIQQASQQISQGLGHLLGQQTQTDQTATALTVAGQQAGTSIGVSMTTAGTTAGQMMGTSISVAGQTAAAAIAAAMAQGQASNGISQLFGVQAHAEGGHIRGPGGPTSDSIVARLSNGEYVMRAAAVSRYGLGFMAAVNDMRLPAVSHAVASIPAPRVSLAPRVAFASGGAVRTGSGPNVHVEVNDNRSSSDPAPQVNTSTMPNGDILVQMILDKAVSQIVRPGTAANKAITSQLGVRNQGVRRNGR